MTKTIDAVRAGFFISTTDGGLEFKPRSLGVGVVVCSVVQLKARGEPWMSVWTAPGTDAEERFRIEARPLAANLGRALGCPVLID